MPNFQTVPAHTYPVYEACEGVDRERGPHHNEQVALCKVSLRQLEKSRGQRLTKERDFGLHQPFAIRAAAYRVIAEHLIGKRKGDTSASLRCQASC